MKAEMAKVEEYQFQRVVERAFEADLGIRSIG
jgi:hypothetical protein